MVFTVKIYFVDVCSQCVCDVGKVHCFYELSVCIFSFYVFFIPDVSLKCVHKVTVIEYD